MSGYPDHIMAPTRPTPRAHPVTSAPPNSPRTDDNQAYRRGRVIRSCLECRRRKMRCDRARPCQNCNRFCRTCLYLPFPEWPSGPSRNTREEGGGSQYPGNGVGRSFPPLNNSQPTALVQPPPLTHHDLGFVSNAPVVHHQPLYTVDVDDETADVALQIGRLSITEQNGRWLMSCVTSQVSVFPLLSEKVSLVRASDIVRVTSRITKFFPADRCTSTSDGAYSGSVPTPDCLWRTRDSAPKLPSSSVYSCSAETDPTPRVITGLSGNGLKNVSPPTRA